jgi:hypothetical protein
MIQAGPRLQYTHVTVRTHQNAMHPPTPPHPTPRTDPILPPLLTQPVAPSRPVLPHRARRSDLSQQRRKLTIPAPKAALTRICPRTGDSALHPARDPPSISPAPHQHSFHLCTTSLRLIVTRHVLPLAAQFVHFIDPGRFLATAIPLPATACRREQDPQWIHHCTHQQNRPRALDS